jgi:hypothetical protein
MAKYKKQKSDRRWIARMDNEGKNIVLFALKARKIITENWLLNLTDGGPVAGWQ